MDETTENRLRRAYKQCGAWEKVPFFAAPSPPVAGLTAMLLAHEDSIDRPTFNKCRKVAEELFHGEPDPKLLRKYKSRLIKNREEWADDAAHRSPGSEIAVNIVRSVPSGDTDDLRWLPIATQASRDINARLNNLYDLKNTRRFISNYQQTGERVRRHVHITARTCTAVGREAIVWPNSRFLLHSEPARRTMRNNNLQLHNTKGYAVTYHDDWAVAAVGGIRIPRKYIENRKLLTVRVIQNTRNMEQRRALMELMGFQNYLRDSEADQVECGLDRFGREAILWRIIQRGDDHDGLNLLDVYNATPEPDGTYKKYYLQVPGNIREVEVALNWMADPSLRRNYRWVIET